MPFLLKKDKFKYIKKKITNIKSFNSKLRESKDKFGSKTFISGEKRTKKIDNINVLNIKKNKMVKIKNLKNFNIKNWKN